jgi:choline/glycine/proline betaine transport protein
MNPPVWIGSALVVVTFVAYAGFFPDQALRNFRSLRIGITEHFGWFYVLAVSVMLPFVLYLVLSRYGHLRLGPDDSRPDFRLIPWLSMLLAAGMGIGIVFFGVSEPLQHYMEPPAPLPENFDRLREAMRFTYFHWGLHPWAVYCCLALPLAYGHFRHELPLAPRSLLYPVLGERIHGWPGHAIDILATTGTLFGVATSLGLGARQINAGLHELTGLPVSTAIQISLIAGITALATVSVVTGLKGGIRFLSTFNMTLAAAFLVFVLVFGPTRYLLELFVDSVGYYIQKLPRTSLMMNPGGESTWQIDWTLFYWSWWISWSPFVGVFVARVSRGRTIREFLLGALLVPTLLGFAWFSVMAGTGVSLTQAGVGSIAEASGDDIKGSAFFAVLRQLPISDVTLTLAVLLIVVFFVTSSDSGSFVDDMVTSGGDPNPPVQQRVFWAIAEGAVAGALLFSGGLLALRSASLVTGLPMAILLLVSCYAFHQQLRRDLPPGSRSQRSGDAQEVKR